LITLVHNIFKNSIFKTNLEDRMILLMCDNVHNSWEPATKLVSRLPGDLQCVSAVRRLAADDLPSLIAIYAPTPPGDTPHGLKPGGF
jgi:hypothetical protein